jgi:hypothetical protein
MPKTTRKPRRTGRGLTLHPMTFEEAMKRLLATPLPPEERRKSKQRKTV